MKDPESVWEAKVTFVAAVKDRKVFEENFLTSPCLHGSQTHEIIVQEQFVSAARAYNDALERSSNDLIIFCHSDLYLPHGWLEDLRRALDYLTAHDSNWGVLGCSGMTVDRRHWRYLYSSGLGISGRPLAHPEPVQTLDEIVLVIRKSSGLRFDETLPHFHLYGTDICLRAAEMGMRSYVISAFCIHNTHQNLILAPEFYDCCRHIGRVWKHSLPIQTTCIRITKVRVPLYLRRLREAYLRHIRRKEFGGRRVKDVQGLVEECTQLVMHPNSVHLESSNFT